MPRTPNSAHRLLAAGLLGLVAPLAAAHDVWIPVPAIDGPPPYPVELRVGHRPPGDPVGRNPRLLRQFLATDERGSRPLPGRPGVHPAGQLGEVRDGVTILSYVGATSVSLLPAARFEAYLQEEGLEWVSAFRAQAGLTEQDGRERFSRSLKTLLQRGTSSKGFDRRLNLPLELTPLSNPFTPGAQTLQVVAEFQGQPLADLRIDAYRMAAPDDVTSVRTDAQGLASLDITPGEWLLAGVHMQPAGPDLPDVDWRSYWATLSFVTPAASADRD